MATRWCSVALGSGSSSFRSRVPRGRRCTVRDYFSDVFVPLCRRLLPAALFPGPRGHARFTAGQSCRRDDTSKAGRTAWTPPGPGPTVSCPGTHTASCFPRVKARAASHRACASSSVRHDTTSLPYLSFFLTLPTPPPRTPLALSPSGRDFCSSRDDVGRGW